MSQIVAQIRNDLKASVDEKTCATFQRFFKDPVTCYGVKTSNVSKIAKIYWKTVRLLSKQELFDACEELLSSDVTEEAFVVSQWLPNVADKFEPNDLIIFERWINLYINNWAKCDSFCNHTVGLFIEKFPNSINELKRWATSKNRWLKRAAAVSLIIPAKHGKFLQETFEIADLLITDKDDIVQKGYGWLLKEESRNHQKEVLSYVLKNRKIMPRTALRYAIELMPNDLRSEAMKKI
jgi:3-methyladenine DNA glycosylase AlkD